MLLIVPLLAGLSDNVSHASTSAETDLNRKAYITSFNTGVVDVIDLANNTVEKAKITVGSQPNSAGFNPTGKQVYVTNRGDGTVSVIDPATDTVISTINVGLSPHGVAFNTDGSKAYIANRNSGTLSVIDTQSLTVTNTISVSGTPTVIVVLGDTLYVSSQTNNGEVAVIDLVQEKTVAIIPVPGGPYGLTVNAAGTKIYTANQSTGTISVIDVATRSIEATVSVGYFPTASEVNPDGSRLYVVNSGSGNVSVIDTSTNTVVNTIAVGSSPYVVGMSADAKSVFTINYGSSTMSVIDAATEKVTETIALSSGPFMVGTFMVSTAAAANPIAAGVAKPSASPASGEVPAGTEVTLSTTTADAAIYYTTDGSVPTTASTKYTGPIVVTEAITLQAIAVKDGQNDSAVMSESYTIEEVLDSLLTPDTASFDQYSAEQPDVATTITLNGNTLTSIEYADTPLLPGTDYTIEGNTVTFSPEYLAQQSVDQLQLTFNFSKGAAQSFTIILTGNPPAELLPAPVLQSAVPGDAEVQLTWSPVEGSSGYKVYQSVTADTYGTELATVQGSVYGYTSSGLTNGTTYYYVVKAVNSAGDSPASNQINATPAAPLIVIPAPVEQTVTLAPAPVPVVVPNTGADVLVNGKLYNIGKITVSQVNNQKVTTITVDEAKLLEQLQAAGPGAVVTLPFTQATDVAIGELNGRMIKNLEANQSVIKLQTPQATYTLPASLLQMDSIAAQLGQSGALQDITLQIRIATPGPDQLKVIDNAAAAGKFSIAAAPLDFSVYATSGGTTIELNTFNSYVERTIQLPADTDASKITTALVIEADGSVHHVPTKVMNAGGLPYAQINSLTNSTYAVVYHPLVFTDVASHWSQDVVNDLGSRMVMNGSDEVTFQPDKDMTRAEFAATLVRALGLKPQSGTASFTDVPASDWYSDELQTAVRYKLIQGFEDQTFRPQDKVTREQAMTMISKAMTYTTLNTEAGVQSSAAALNSFTDAKQVSVWAAAGVNASLQAGIVTGRSGNLLAPEANVTRAEVAAMIHRFLEKSGLI
jgi:YVTN family beta-propeller protein